MIDDARIFLKSNQQQRFALSSNILFSSPLFSSVFIGILEKHLKATKCRSTTKLTNKVLQMKIAAKVNSHAACRFNCTS